MEEVVGKGEVVGEGEEIGGSARLKASKMAGMDEYTSPARSTLLNTTTRGLVIIMDSSKGLAEANGIRASRTSTTT